MAQTSARERRLWWQAALVQLAIYASLAYVRGPSDWLRANNLLRLTVGALFLAAAVVILWKVGRRRPGIREVLVLVAFGVIYLIVLLSLRQVEERVHFLEYGLVGGLVYSALRARRRNHLDAGEPLGLATRFAAPVAIVITGLAGWGDEGIQALLPERVYELRDVALNVSAGVLVISAIVVRRWAGTIDRSARERQREERS